MSCFGSLGWVMISYVGSPVEVPRLDQFAEGIGVILRLFPGSTRSFVRCWDAGARAGIGT